MDVDFGAVPGEEQTAMSKIFYRVAMSLDGYIAGPKGEADWIVRDPEVNFAEIWARFDTLLMGRRTYEAAASGLGNKATQGKKLVVVSRTLRPRDHPDLIILPELNREQMRTIRAQSAKDIWLFGGGELFRTLLELHEVEMVEVAVIPVLLGEGVQLLPSSTQQTRLKLESHKIYRSGIVSLAYEVLH
jgi:dihydrofolate reductase